MTTRRNILRLLTGAPLIAQQAATALASAATVTSGAAGLANHASEPAIVGRQPTPAFSFLKGGYKTYHDLRDALDEIQDSVGNEMPYDIASKRSWSEAMKQSEWTKRRAKLYKTQRLLNQANGFPDGPIETLRSINAMKEVAAMLGKDIEI